MHAVIGTIAWMLIFICVSTSPIAEQQGPQDILQAEEKFVSSLVPEQQTRWIENRQRLFDSVVSPTTDVSDERDQNDEADEEAEDFIKSLSPIQRRYWFKLRNKAARIVAKFEASRGLYPAIKHSGRAACGAGCISSTQCSNYDNGNRNCRCSWFLCGLV
ncbi:unnamed protein product [Adineta steineri]|uniref:Uncharacterized protein n=1 Tax=Adineta steineri TaxID=433720 RepID=A0A815MFU0_9BILA|nr:unnamed protein product [Adineta steineri]CAF4149853.1 unnamed protein product [Adineta steineri]